MVVVLDSNHFTEFVRGAQLGRNLKRRIAARNADVFVSIVTAQESFEGWLALIRRQRAGRNQIKGYAEFQLSMETLMRFTVLPFDEEAATHFHRLQTGRVRIGTMDLKIASICLAHDSTLLTRNLVDFEKVPGLRVENWLD